MTSFLPKTGILKVWGGHLVLLINDDVIDPSYETFSAPDSEYFDSIAVLLKRFPSLKDDKKTLQHAITSLLEFKAFAQRINDGNLTITNRAYYNAQADHLERLLG